MKRRGYTQKDFLWTKASISYIKSLEKKILFLKTNAYEQVKKIPHHSRTFENTIVAIATSGDVASDLFAQIAILQNASPKKSVRDAATEVEKRLNTQLVEIEYDKALYDAVEAYAKKKEKLLGADKILFDDMRKGYTRMGFKLSEEKQRILKSNLKKITLLGSAFDKNVNEYTDTISVTKEELDGLPDSYISTLKKDKKGKYIISLAYPESLPFLAGAHNDKKRKELAEKKSKKGGKKNLALISKMFEIRKENAQLLGYDTHVDFVAENKMAKSAKNIERFLLNLEKKTAIAGKKDRTIILDFKRTRTANPRARLESHDIGYLFKQYRREHFAIDGDFVKEHFPFEHVKEATLSIYEELFELSFQRRKDISLWHTDVQFYDIYTKKEQYRASFALDLYPREGKYGHAAVFDCVAGRKQGNEYIAPVAVMMTNFTKPTKENPSLLSHGEVETFFHEFGHVMHYTLTTATYQVQSGTNVARDFVEAPSQMLENWVWEPEMIKRLSKHYKTKKSLPDDLIRKMIETRFFGEAWSTRGQIVLALLDFILHTKAIKNPNELYAKLNKKILGIAPPKGQLYLAGFGHLAHGYDAGYYGYLWSKVYAEDMYTRFKKEGIVNPKVGHSYVSWILEKGSSVKEIDLVKGFLGRAPNNKAFLTSIGI